MRANLAVLYPARLDQQKEIGFSDGIALNDAPLRRGTGLSKVSQSKMLPTPTKGFSPELI